MFLPILAFGTPSIPVEVPEECDINSPASRGRRQRRRFTAQAMLGQGGFGLVKLVRKKIGSTDNLSDDMYAMKIIDKWSIIESKCYDPCAEKYATNELRIGILASKLSTPFLSKLHNAFQTDNKLYFIFDYLSGGEMYEIMEASGEGLPVRTATFYLAEIISGLTALHNAKVLHRDLRLENILLDKRGHARICDFGLALFLTPEDDPSIRPEVPILERRTTNVFVAANPLFMPPEYYQCADGYGLPMDFWQLGIMAYAMLKHEYPPKICDNFGEKLQESLAEFPPECLELVQGLLEPMQEKRLGYRKGCEELKAHKFFADIDWNNLPEEKDSDCLITNSYVECDLDDAVTEQGRSQPGCDSICHQAGHDVLIFRQFSFNGSIRYSRQPSFVRLLNASSPRIDEKDSRYSESLAPPSPLKRPGASTPTKSSPRLQQNLLTPHGKEAALRYSPRQGGSPQLTPRGTLHRLGRDPPQLTPRKQHENPEGAGVLAESRPCSLSPRGNVCSSRELTPRAVLSAEELFAPDISMRNTAAVSSTKSVQLGPRKPSRPVMHTKVLGKLGSSMQEKDFGTSQILFKRDLGTIHTDVVFESDARPTIATGRATAAQGGLKRLKQNAFLVDNTRFPRFSAASGHSNIGLSSGPPRKKACSATSAEANLQERLASLSLSDIPGNLGGTDAIEEKKSMSYRENFRQANMDVALSSDSDDNLDLRMSRNMNVCADDKSMVTCMDIDPPIIVRSYSQEHEHVALRVIDIRRKSA